MQFKIETRQLDLPQRVERGVESARAHQALQHVDRQGFAAVHMRGYERQNLRSPDEVLHELTGKFHGVPGNAVDAGDAGVGHARQHVMQAVAELMKQRGHLVMRQQRGRAADRGGEIAHQLGHRQRRPAGRDLATTHSSIQAPLRFSLRE